jgi:uncharacterized protein YkwD
MLYRVLLSSVLMVVVAAAGLSCKSGGITLPGDFNLTTERQAMIARHNNTRSGVGQGALAENATLDQIAMAQAQYMSSIGDSTHEDANGDHVDTRATDAGYSWVTIGENVGFDTDAAELYSLWLNSGGHYSNIIDSDYTEIGVGAVQSGIYQYWCIVFGDR